MNWPENTKFDESNSIDATFCADRLSHRLKVKKSISHPQAMQTVSRNSFWLIWGGEEKELALFKLQPW